MARLRINMTHEAKNIFYVNLMYYDNKEIVQIVIRDFASMLCRPRNIFLFSCKFKVLVKVHCFNNIPSRWMILIVVAIGVLLFKYYDHQHVFHRNSTSRREIIFFASISIGYKLLPAKIVEASPRIFQNLDP